MIDCVLGVGMEIVGGLTVLGYLGYSYVFAKKNNNRVKEKNLCDEKEEILETYRDKRWRWNIPNIPNRLEEGMFEDYPDLEHRAITLCKVANIKIDALERCHGNIEREKAHTVRTITKAYNVIVGELNSRNEKLAQYENEVSQQVMAQADKVLDALCQSSEWGEEKC